MEDYNRFISSFLSAVERELNGYSYRGVDVLGFLRMPIYLQLKKSYQAGDKASDPGMLGRLRKSFGNIKRIFRFGKLFVPRFGKRTPSAKAGFTAFTIDYDFPAYLDMQRGILEELGCTSLFLITQDKSLYKKIKGMFPEQPVICPFHHMAISIGPRNLRLLAELFRKSKKLSDGSLSFKLVIAFYFLRGVNLVDFYISFLEKGKFDSLVTLCDTHSHENILANIAKQKRIRTFTLQHGFTCRFYAPVSSDRIFVWGDVSKKELLDLNVPEEKIVISGKVGFTENWIKFIKNRQEYRNEFTKKYGLDPSKQIVSFFPTRYSEEVNRTRFACFAGICDLDISPLIKVRTVEEISQHKKWLDEFKVGKKVPIIQGGDLLEVLNASDIVITAESSVGVEALPFSVIVILLDIFENIDLMHWITNYSDSLAVKSGGELYSLVKRIINDEEYRNAEKNRSFRCSAKYFRLNEGMAPASVIGEFIRGAAGREGPHAEREQRIDSSRMENRG